MIIERITGANVDAGKDQEEYVTLPVRFAMHLVEDGKGNLIEIPGYTFAVSPTPEELKAINAGANIEITILGLAQVAPCHVAVGSVPS